MGHGKVKAKQTSECTVFNAVLVSKIVIGASLGLSCLLPVIIFQGNGIGSRVFEDLGVRAV